ncbi:hypothetical protein MMC25_005092 [Agyrium rufum]|nr:hypothetical protein [Agyrium rufum]
MASKYGTIAHLLNPNYKTDVTRWLAEDCPTFDYGGFVVGEDPGEAKLLGKSSGMLAGVPFFDEVFRQLDCTVEWHFPEGHTITPIAHVATVRGPMRKILLGERVALNTLARCSGIAAATSHLKAILESHSPTTALAGTRKTTPGFRIAEKYSILVGGADQHRYDLSAMTMLKDNHIWARGGDIRAAVTAAKAAGGFAIKVDVECQSEEEASEAIEAGADVVMLDNFSAEGVKVASRSLKERYKGKREFLIEVSGGLTPENVGMYACAEVDILSTSSIHQGVKHVDFSLKIVH